MHWRRKSRRKEKGVGGTENRRGMLRWRTGRGKPQEGVRGREVKRVHERERQGRKNKKIRERGRGHIGAPWKQMFPVRGGQTLMCGCVTPEGRG